MPVGMVAKMDKSPSGAAQWYAAQVLTGDELQTVQALEDAGFNAIAPMEWRMERKGGRLHERAHIYLPGYVFVRANMDAATYYAIRAANGSLRLLGTRASSDHWPTPIPPAQMRLLMALWAHGKTGKPANVVRNADGTTALCPGGLTDVGARIVRVDRRAGRATIAARVLDKTCQATIMIRYTGESGE